MDTAMTLHLKEFLQEYGILDYAIRVNCLTPEKFSNPPIQSIRYVWRLEHYSRSFIITCFPSRNFCKIMIGDLAANNRETQDYIFDYTPEKFQTSFHQVLENLGLTIHDFSRMR